MLTAALLGLLAVLLWPARYGVDRSAAFPAHRPSVPAADPAIGDVASGAVGSGNVVAGGHGLPASRPAARLRRRVSRRRCAEPWVADFAEVVSVGLDAGLDLPSAALMSARSPGVVASAPWLAGHLRHCVDSGRGVTSLLESGAELEADERGDLGLLAGAWTLVERVGAAASAVTASAAASIRERRSAVDRTAVVVAGPRASMVLLSALPLAGPLAAAVVGMPPPRLYDSTASRLLAGTGVTLTALGWWWARMLLRRAGRAGHTDDGPR